MGVLFRMKNNSVLTISLGVFLLGTFVSSEAYAYIDPGTGSMIIQMLIGALVGVGITVKIYWNRLKFKFDEKFKSRQKSKL